MCSFSLRLFLPNTTIGFPPLKQTPVNLPKIQIRSEEEMNGKRILKKLKSIPTNPINIPDPFRLRSILGDISSSLITSYVAPTGDSSDDDTNDDESDKENLIPCSSSTTHKQNDPKSSPNFRRPLLNSPTLFDPALLAAFRSAVDEYYKETQLPQSSNTKTDQTEKGPLFEFDHRCPPGGIDSVILYTTSIRGIRKTFEDCNRLKSLLKTLRVVFYERDISIHLDFRDELWEIMGEKRVIPPRLFVRGRYTGGADEVLRLHELGNLVPLLEGLPVAGTRNSCCVACSGLHFLPCFECNGSRRKRRRQNEGEEGAAEEEEGVKCERCNENGLVVCSLCSCRC